MIGFYVGRPERESSCSSLKVVFVLLGHPGLFDLFRIDAGRGIVWNFKIFEIEFHAKVSIVLVGEYIK